MVADMLWWEFGELTAAGLAMLGLTESRWQRLQHRWPWLACHCEARRKWLNQTGERLWRWLCPRGYADFRRAWWQVVRRELFVGIISASDLHHHLLVVWLGTSERTMKCWLDGLAQQGLIASIVLEGQKHYGLPADNATMLS